MNVSIEIYTTKTLQNFINSEQFNNLKNFPITPHRALSHINNPRADADDKILYLAYINKELVGYRLILVDEIRIDNNKEKVGWYSCVWIHPSYRGKGIAKQLVDISLNDWDNKILFQGPVKASKNLYSRTGNFNNKEIIGFRGYARFDSSSIISSKLPQLSSLLFMFKFLDNSLNLFFDLRFSKINLNKSANIKLVEEIDDEINNFLTKNSNNNLFARTKTEYNWILNYPWIKESDTIDHISRHYHFSSIATKFKYLCYKVYNNKELDGFIIFQLRDNHLSIQYAQFSSEQLMSIINLINSLLKNNKINYFTSYHKAINNYYFTHKDFFLFRKKIKRSFFFAKYFEKYFKKNPQLLFEAGDGDMIFT